MAQAAMGPQLRSLVGTRRLLITMLAVMLVAVATMAARGTRPGLNDVERVGLLASIVLVVVGAVLSGRTLGLWLCDASMFALVLTALVAPHGTPPWLPMPNAANYAFLLAIVFTGRRVGLVLALASPLLIVLVWAERPTNIVASSLRLAGGWIVVAQTLATCLAAWWAWNTLRREAQAADLDMEERRQRTEGLAAQRERARLWRDSGLRVHESVLNSIRYVLSAEHLDRDRLAREIDVPLRAPEAGEAHDLLSIDRLLADVLNDPVAAEVLRPPSRRPRARLEPEVAQAARGAIVEAVHNAVSHGSASEVRVDFETEPAGVLVVRVVDNGSGMPARPREGIGMGQVLTASLAAVGAEVVVRPHRFGGTEVELRLPAQGVAAQSWRRVRSYPPFDKGRLLVTAALAASALVGIAYYVLLGEVMPLDRTGGIHVWLAIVCGIAGSVIAISLVLRRKHTTALAGIGLILVPALVPWFLRTAEYGCGESPVLSAALNTAGFAVIVIAAWSGALPGAVGIITWAVGSYVVAGHIPHDCREGVVLALSNAVLILPLTMAVTYVGVRTAERAAAREAEGRRREVVEASRAATESDLNAGLYAAVEEAAALLAAIAHGADTDEALRLRLESVDARLRAAIQVDSALAGGMAVSAKRVVDAACAEGAQVTVRSLRASDDVRLLPAPVEWTLIAAVRGSRVLVPVLQVFTDGEHDYLSVLVDDNGLAVAGQRAGEPWRVADVELLALAEDDVDPTAGYSVLVTRPVSAPAAV